MTRPEGAQVIIGVLLIVVQAVRLRTVRRVVADPEVSDAEARRVIASVMGVTPPKKLAATNPQTSRRVSR